MPTLTIRQAVLRLEKAVRQRAVALTRNVATPATRLHHMKKVQAARKLLTRTIRQGQYKRR